MLLYADEDFPLPVVVELRQLGLDVTAYHEPRRSDWFSQASYESVVSTMRSNGRPAYLQESMSTRDDLFFYPNHDRAEYFLQAIAHAKLAGAAAWCFHTDVGVDYRFGPPFLEDRLRSYAEPEWAFVNSLNARVLLQTSNGVNYVVAEGGGGGASVPIARLPVRAPGKRWASRRWQEAH